MTVNVSQVLTAFNGNPLMWDGHPLTLRTVLVEALLGAPKEECGKPAPSRIEKLKRFSLAQDIYKSETVFELTASDRDMIFQLVNSSFPIIVVGQVNQLLEEHKS